MKFNQAALEEKVSYVFSCRSLLEGALHHPSQGGKLFQRLEFLGDRVLSLIISHWLYERYPLDAEGSLAKRLVDLVRKETLLRVGMKLDLWKVIGDTPNGEITSTRMVADMCEALLGAIYLDGGLEASEKVVRVLWEEEVFSQEKPPIDPKSALQEYLQERKLSTPCYYLEKQEGPSHAPWFLLRLSIGEKIFFGKGSSKREAEKKAALEALQYFSQ